jgi:PAP_fibrillin
MVIGKLELLERLAGLNRGLLANEPDRLSIQSAIAYLEDRNPTPLPLEATDLLEGNWRLLYTTSQDLLGLGRFPVVQLGQIYQCIRTQTAQIYNIAELTGLPFLESVVSVSAQFTPVSEKRVEVEFKRSVLGLQRLLPYESPDQLIRLLNSPTKPKAIDFKINAQGGTQGGNQSGTKRRAGWLDVTYLDQDLRIGRGNEGSLFVLTKF